MGASGWSYTVPWQADPDAALRELHKRVFAEGDYWWAEGGYWVSNEDVPAEKRAAVPPPASLTDLIAAEQVAYDGTHSILDMARVLRPGEEPGHCTVEMVTADESRRTAGTDRPTRDHLDALDDLVRGRWMGRCVVLHHAAGDPAELHFWGYSGD
ncbi:hypothetical protein ACL02O_26245 [Micromonospora sp. MS34]|uniref:hypothetical protein n=1 Tax=Micromonospora sp. MS34 TaxID=3385971 RepID=UPI0039A2A5EA